MLIRISLIVAILAGLATAGISFIKVKEKIETVKIQRDGEKRDKETAQTDLANTKNDLKKSEDDLKQTKTDLAATQQERDKAVAEAATQVKRANDLSNDLTKTKQDRDDARAELAAWAALGIPVNQVKGVIAQAKKLQEQTDAQLEEINILTRKVRNLANELAKYRDPEYRVFLPANLRGTILVADPKWDFVVLNVGEDQGVLEDGELLVNRNGRLVAKVRVRSVQKDRCIANVMPGWKLGDVVEGDLVIPAYPAS